MLLLLASAAAAAAPPRVAVWGGSGFLGSRVARTLVDAGCSVVSLSRTGKPPPWAERQAWAEQVSWQRADALGEDALAPRMGRIDAAVSCIGNMRPSTEWEGFFGLHWDYETMLRENGDVNERVAEAARQAGARRFTLVSVASVTKWAYGGALEGYIDGKLEGERAVLRLFGDANSCFVGPTLLYGGARFAGAGKLLATVCDTPALRGQIAFFKWLKGNAATGYAPNDAAGEVATTPPCDVDVVARAVCACVLGTTPLSKLSESHAAQQLREDVIRFDVEAPDEMLDRPFPALYSTTYVDGTDQINEVAAAAATPQLLSAAAASGLREGGELPPADVAAPELGGTAAAIQALRQRNAASASGETPAAHQSLSAFGAPYEGALVGFRPFLFPIPPAATLVGAFGGAILAGLMT